MIDFFVVLVRWCPWWSLSWALSWSTCCRKLRDTSLRKGLCDPSCTKCSLPWVRWDLLLESGWVKIRSSPKLMPFFDIILSIYLLFSLLQIRRPGSDRWCASLIFLQHCRSQLKLGAMIGGAGITKESTHWCKQCNTLVQASQKCATLYCKQHKILKHCIIRGTLSEGIHYYK